jgi:glycosyltransferase involved in cell wall biosynthesis
MRKIRLAIVASHPIQYQVPWFRGLAKQPDVELKVCFALLPDAAQQGTGFRVRFQWDIPLLDGYSWVALENVRRYARLDSFFGSSTPGILSALRGDRPDVVLINGWNALPLLQALRAARRLGILRVVRGESNSLWPRPAWKRFAHRQLLAQYDAFLAIGKANRQFYAANGVPDSRIFSAPYFVDNDRFEGSARAAGKQVSRLRWNIAADAFCVLFAGKLEPKKRILDLVRALGLVLRQGANVHLLVAGAGPLMEDARALAGRERVPFTFTGFLNQTELPQAYAAADVLVLPSDFGETWGLVVNEAMACGLPAIVSDRVGCGPDLVEPGVTGAVFPFGDVQALARCVLELAADPERARTLGLRAKERVREYSAERAVMGTMEAVHFLMGRDAGGRQ